ncbi:Ig-like domain-containing protein [Clostridium lundense]|uniref:Ig-like domain-containing protein n=1 Tax=Clostridium lundense TaxID=319475 RepID=UPI000489CB8A|nr:Ig-like domain-containing protein [Clostridium lundense]
MFKEIKNKLIVITLLFGAILIAPIKVFAIDNSKLSSKEVSKDKIWMIRFNIKLDSNTINNSVIVKDLSGNKINIKLKLSDDGKTILVYPPVNNYDINKEYILYVEDNIKSVNSRKLKSGAIVNFFVKDNTSSSGSSSGSSNGGSSTSSINAIAKVEVSPVMKNFKVINIKSSNNSNIKKFKIEGNNNLFDIGKAALSIVNDDKVTIYFYGEDGNNLIGKGTLDVSRTADNLDIKIQ